MHDRSLQSARQLSELRKQGYAVIGVSVDDEISSKFISKNELPFPLIADTDKTLVEQFGVWGEKNVWQNLFRHIPHHIHHQ